MGKNLLISYARELTDEEAGGHGDRWGVFSDDLPEFMTHWIGATLESAEVVLPGMGSREDLQQAQAIGEPAAAGLLCKGPDAEATPSGMLSLLHPTDRGYEMMSCYPFLGVGVEVEAEVEQIFLFPNRVEAVLELGLPRWGLIEAFDSCFWQNRAIYKAGERYRVVLSGLAYRISPAPSSQFEGDDQVDLSGVWRDNSLEGSLEKWTFRDERPAAESLSQRYSEPGCNSSERMVGLVPYPTGTSGDAFFLGQVVGVTQRAVRILDVDFCRVDALVMRAEEDLVLPIFVAERLLGEAWSPAVGEYVVGILWLQTFAIRKVDTNIVHM